MTIRDDHITVDRTPDVNMDDHRTRARGTIWPHLNTSHHRPGHTTADAGDPECPPGPGERRRARRRRHHGRNTACSNRVVHITAENQNPACSAALRVPPYSAMPSPRPHPVRTRALASLRNLAVNALRLTGRRDITEARRQPTVRIRTTRRRATPADCDYIHLYHCQSHFLIGLVCPHGDNSIRGNLPTSVDRLRRIHPPCHRSG